MTAKYSIPEPVTGPATSWLYAWFEPHSDTLKHEIDLDKEELSATHALNQDVVVCGRGRIEHRLTFHGVSEIR